MSLDERLGTRDLTYSRWHRPDSIARFIPMNLAAQASQIDLDAAIFIEYDDGRKLPLALVEFARFTGAFRKASTITKTLAKQAGIPAYVVLYSIADAPNPVDPAYRDISMFHVRKVNPEPEGKWIPLTPQMWAQQLLAIRGYCAKIAGLDMPEAGGTDGRP